MSPRTRWGPRLALLLPAGTLVLGELLAAASPRLTPPAGFAQPIVLFGLLLAGVLASMHRPLGGSTLGFGAFVLPLALLVLGVAPAGLLALLVGPLAETIVARLRRGAASPEVRSVGVVITQAVRPALATLAVGWAVSGLPTLARPLPAVLVSTWIVVPALLYLVVWLGWWLAEQLLAGRPLDGVWAQSKPLSIDVVGWMVGMAVAVAHVVAGWPLAGLLCAALALLAAESARVAILRGRSEERVDDFRRLQQAHRRILAETSGMAGIASQILVECSNVLPFHTFQLEVEEAEEGRRSFSAGADRALQEGDPELPVVPPMLPGVHRRAAWRRIEHALEVEGEPLGVLRLWCDPRRVEPSGEELLATLVPLMASSLHRARLDREAKIDPLTGVPVRRVLESRMQAVYRQSCEEGLPMAVILCDIDHFKQVNDTHGHAAGDEALRQVARALDTTRRDSDLCCRYGGEEFTVLLESTTGDAALRVAERLRRAVEGLRVVFEGVAIPLTLSAGVAAFPELHIKTASELQLLADEALYAAKENGRNRVLLHVGRGRYRDATGRTYGGPESEAISIEPPRLLS